MTNPTESGIKLPKQDWMQKSATRAVMKALTRGGAEALFVGGCVRDSLLDRKDIDNIDIATPITPDQVVKLLKNSGFKTIPTGFEHGTVTAIADDEVFEITTLRRDTSTDGRHATVAFTDNWLTDANRRDFTINAMYCDIEGILYDPLGGADDLKSGKIRFVGSAGTRIEEDALRILRFFRFYAHFGKNQPNVEALAACSAAAEKIDMLSSDRIRIELLKWLDAPDPTRALEYARDCGVLAYTLKFSPDQNAFARMESLLSIETETKRQDPMRRLAALTNTPEQRTSLSNHLNLPKKSQRRLESMFTSTFRLIPNLSDKAACRFLYRVGPECFTDITLIAWAQASSKNSGSWHKLLELADNWHKPKCPVSGVDIIALGVPTGPTIGEIFGDIEDWWIAGNFQAGREQTLAQLRRILDARAR